jgi:hypothetical protein
MPEATHVRSCLHPDPLSDADGVTGPAPTMLRQRHTLVGFGSALIMLVSKYGFTDVLGTHVVLDSARVGP